MLTLDVHPQTGIMEPLHPETARRLAQAVRRDIREALKRGICHGREGLYLEKLERVISGEGTYYQVTPDYILADPSCTCPVDGIEPDAVLILH